MMDLMILVAVFVAILALAYFTYRNIVGLDTRLRKIEDVLKNAEVVAAPPSRVQEHPEAPVQHAAPAPSDPGDNTQAPGWGGEGPPVNVERVLPNDESVQEHVENTDEDEDDDTTSEYDEEENRDDSTPEENKREKSKYASIRVGDLRDALKKAGVPFPNGAKKSLLVSLVEHNDVEISS